MDDVSEDFIFRSQIGHLEHTYDRLPYRLYLKEKENLWYPLKTQKPSKKIGYFEKKHTRLRMEISEKSHKYFLEAKQKNDINYFITKMSKYDTSYRRITKILLAKRFGIMKSFKKIFRKIFRKR